MSNSKDSLPDDVVLRLLETLGPRAGEGPSDELRARVLQRVAVDGAAKGITTVRAGEGEWAPFIPGVVAKVLYDDGARRTWLARLDPGARVPAHAHAGDEEILLLEGSCHVGGVPMERGDYQFSPSGTFHEEMTTATGCLLFLRSRSPAAARS